MNLYKIKFRHYSQKDSESGIKTYLFLNYTENVEQKIRSKIIKQVAMYIPIIKIINLDFSSGVDYNSLGIRIEYSIPDLGTTDLLEFTI